jgi:hypothetical protein
MGVPAYVLGVGRRSSRNFRFGVKDTIERSSRPQTVHRLILSSLWFNPSVLPGPNGVDVGDDDLVAISSIDDNQWDPHPSGSSQPQLATCSVHGLRPKASRI